MKTPTRIKFYRISDGERSYMATLPPKSSIEETPRQIGEETILRQIEEGAVFDLLFFSGEDHVFSARIDPALNWPHPLTKIEITVEAVTCMRCRKNERPIISGLVGVDEVDGHRMHLRSPEWPQAKSDQGIVFAVNMQAPPRGWRQWPGSNKIGEMMCYECGKLFDEKLESFRTETPF